MALAGDGNIALIGDMAADAAFVFTRAGSTWSQQGVKLTATGGIGVTPFFGASVALSGDGSTALIGAPFDQGSVGAAFVFTRAGSTWTQQGAKLTATGGWFGFSVALSGDGNIALIGAPFVNTAPGESLGVGAAWVFTRSGSTWTQQGPKLTGAGERGTGQFGWGVALSGAGGSALVGGPSDNRFVGAAWAFVFTSPPRPVISHARLNHRRFRVGRKATAITARRTPRGTSFQFTLSTSARLQIKITRSAPGLRSGRRCVAPTATLRRRRPKRCKRTLTVGALTRAHELAGADRVAFSGRLGHRALRTDAYNAVLSATNAGGRSKPVTVKFTVVR